MTNRTRLEIERTSGLQDVKAGDIVVMAINYGHDWETLAVESTTPTRIRTSGQEWDKSNGGLRGQSRAPSWAERTIYPSDHPRYVAWVAKNTELAGRLAPLLHTLSTADLAGIAAKLGVKP